MDTPASRSKNVTADVERPGSEDEAERVREDVKAFIAGRNNYPAYLITLRKDGRPHTRPVAAFVEGWTVGTISQGQHLKNQHIRNNPQVGYLWVERDSADKPRPKSVWLQGNCEIVDDPAEVEAFFARRAAIIGRPDAHPDDEYVRLLLRTTPTLVRAEGFLEAPTKPVLYRDFSR